MDRLMLGLSTTGVGMLVVFSGLVILIACIYAMTTVMKKGAKQSAAKASPVPEASAAPAPTEPEQEEEEQDDLQLAAVIAAAVAAIWQDEGNKSGFVVRRIRRAQNSTARARAARDEQIYSRL